MFISFMHYEKQPHDYAAALTTFRNGGVSDGGHFYLGAYGIKVEATANSLVVWQPKHVHGTSLQNRSPYDKNPEFLQQGLAIVTSARLPTIWEKYVKNVGLDLTLLTAEAKKAVKAIFFDDDDEIEDLIE